MADAGVDAVAIETFAHYYRLLEHGETGMIPESTIEPVDMERLDDVEVERRRRRAGDPDDRGDQAQRRPRHVDGHGPRQVAALRAQGAVLPRHHRPAGAPPPQGVRRAAADAVHEQLPDQRRHDGRARALRGPAGRRAAAGVPAEQGAQAPRQGPLAGRLARGPRPRVVPARPRRHLHRAARHRPARAARRGRLRPRVRLQLRQPRRRAGRAGGRLVRDQRRAVRDRGGPPYAERPQGRPLRPAQVRRPDHPARVRPDARRGQGRARRPRAAPVLLDQQPLVRPARDEGGPRRPRRHPRPAADPQREDRRPGRPRAARRSSRWRPRWAPPSRCSRTPG